MSISNNENSPLPLSGLRVIEFGQCIAVPAAAQVLADLGADVIKIEAPSGDPARHSGWTSDLAGPMFTAYNRGKRSVVLDLRSELGRDNALKLALSADVVLQNARPASMEKQGLGSARLLALAPRLVYGQVSGFGRSGLASTRPGLDIAAQAESGMMSLNGESGRDPLRVGFTVVDTLASQTLTNGVLAALLRRVRTGKGGLVDVSLIDVAVASISNAWAEYRLSDVMPLRKGNGQPSMAPAADVLNTQDGQVVLSAYTQDHFSKLCQVIGKPELIMDPRFSNNQARVKHRVELLQILGDLLKKMPSETFCELLNQGGVVAGVVRNMAQVKPGQAGVSDDLFVEVVSGQRKAVFIPGLPMNLDGFCRVPGRLPDLGEHTDEVLSELQS
jgi:crotonobetainyl-CoA:carnitine CoA-transferase CaiB-like acyl-CoA transferase